MVVGKFPCFLKINVGVSFTRNAWSPLTSQNQFAVFLANRDGTADAKFHSTMKSPLSHRGTKAFTLVELLTVVAIIGILAALLLPALQQGKARAKLVGCQSNLEQLGIAFHSFAHDHNSKFPMQTPFDQGGAQEFVQNGYRVNGEFYFAYRVFQSLADALATPNILICPTDTRLAATNFISLRNKNLSYFVGVDADYFQPESILAGDRNLITGAEQSIYPAAGRLVRWSGAMHQFKGNLLFADGHVEESKGFSLAGGTGGPVAQNDFFVPSVKAEAASSPPVSTGQEASAANQPSPASGNSTNTPSPAHPAPVGLNGRTGDINSSATTPVVTQVATESQTNSDVAVQSSTNTVAAMGDDLPGMSFFDRRRMRFFLSLIGWGFLLWLLLFLLWLAYTCWRHWRRHQSKR